MKALFTISIIALAIFSSPSLSKDNTIHVNQKQISHNVLGLKNRYDFPKVEIGESKVQMINAFINLEEKEFATNYKVEENPHPTLRYFSVTYQYNLKNICSIRVTPLAEEGCFISEDKQKVCYRAYENDFTLISILRGRKRVKIALDRSNTNISRLQETEISHHSDIRQRVTFTTCNGEEIIFNDL